MHLYVFQIDKWFFILLSACRRFSRRSLFFWGCLISCGLYKSQSQPLISGKYYCLKILLLVSESKTLF